MSGPARVMVSGSRSWTDREQIKREFQNWQEVVGADQVTLIHGDARGADRLAASVARELGWEVDPMPADWLRFGKRAGYVRNMAMLAREPHHVFIFWDGESRGTKHVIDAVQSGRQSYSITKVEDAPPV